MPVKTTSNPRWDAGLGTTVDALRRLCRDDAEALDAIDAALRMPEGRPVRGDGETVNNVHGFPAAQRPQGNSAERALRALRDHAPELHAEVLAGRATPHGAMVAAGRTLAETGRICGVSGRPPASQNVTKRPASRGPFRASGRATPPERCCQGSPRGCPCGAFAGLLRGDGGEHAPRCPERPATAPRANVQILDIPPTGLLGGSCGWPRSSNPTNCRI